MLRTHHIAYPHSFQHCQLILYQFWILVTWKWWKKEVDWNHKEYCNIKWFVQVSSLYPDLQFGQLQQRHWFAVFRLFLPFPHLFLPQYLHTLPIPSCELTSSACSGRRYCHPCTACSTFILLHGWLEKRTYSSLAERHLLPHQILCVRLAAPLSVTIFSFDTRSIKIWVFYSMRYDIN